MSDGTLAKRRRPPRPVNRVPVDDPLPGDGRNFAPATCAPGDIDPALVRLCEEHPERAPAGLFAQLCAADPALMARLGHLMEEG